MPNFPKIAFATTYKGRLPHLIQTLPKNIADNADYPNAVFILLLYNDCLDMRIADEVRSGRVVVYQFDDGTNTFRMAHAKNLATRCAMLEGADIIVNVDADNYTGKGFAQYVADQFAANRNCFLWARKPISTPRGCTGRIAVTPQQFLKAGGYDEKYSAYGPDDKDFTARLLRLNNKAVEIDQQYLGIIPHGNTLRFREYPHVTDISLYEEFELVNDCDNTVVNYGRIGCGRVFRNFTDKPIYIAPVPTRVFGIGLHKTATSSLHKALQILGYDSAHWESGDWAKAIWTEMKSFGRSWTMERYYALSDLPIALLYKELDCSYPGSKFILTVRNEDKWLSSVRNHWDRKRNAYRWEWDVYPFSNQIHKQLYGRSNFDEAVFRARYRQHNEAVRVYFRDRPDDLVTLNVDNGDGWPQLCGFLGRPIPASISFPKEYQTL